MKKILLLATAFALIISGCSKNNDPEIADNDLVITTSAEVIPGQYVVLLKSGVSEVKAAATYEEAELMMTDITRSVLKSSGIAERDPLFVYASAVGGFAVTLSESEVALLQSNEKVAGIWPDMMFTLARPEVSATALPAQVVPAGITRVGGGATYTGTKKAWIIDTGIDYDHPDLNVNTTLAVTYVRTKTADDDNGHGTHCAGIVAAIDNTVGVVGVAAGATVIPVKVLDRKGSGAYSGIIKGCDYVTANGVAGDAANMSLGGGIYDPIDQAVLAMGAKGIFVAIAAGNEAQDANNCSPAHVNGTNIYTISACNSSDVWAYFSNYGNPPIDYCAPGVSILSTYKGGTLATLSGTSMAAPHACGVLLATGGHPTTSGYVSGDPDGVADPIIHE